MSSAPRPITPQALLHRARLSVLCASLIGVWPAAWARNQAGEVTFTLGLVSASADATQPSAARALRVGDKVFEGERLSTGPGGHVHIRTVDGGLLALRPETRARIELYEYAAAQPISLTAPWLRANGNGVVPASYQTSTD